MEKLQTSFTSIPVYPKGLLLYVLYISDLATSRDTTLGSFADDTAIFATHDDSTIVSLNPQEHLHIIEKGLKK
jgi:hypothetical protein